MRHQSNLLKLLQANAARPRNWSIKAADELLTVYIYDVIGGYFGGVDAEEVVKAIVQSTAKRIELKINSPGGDVFDARAIATALRSHSAEVIASIEGYAASAASTIAMAADRVEIATGGFIMIHNAWGFVMGNKNDLVDMAALLEKIDVSIANDYVTRTGATLEQVAEWMNAETWFNDQESVDNGFADAIIEKKAAANAWDLAAYNHAPKVDDDRVIRDRQLVRLESLLARRPGETSSA